MTLVYLSPVDWDSYEQRPHYFAYDFLANGGDSVIWVNPYPGRLPSWRDLSRKDLKNRRLDLTRPKGLTVLDAGGLPVDPLPGGRALNSRLFWNGVIHRLKTDTSGRDMLLGIGRPSAFARAAIDELPGARSFYDAMDDFPEFYRGRSRALTRHLEREIAARVDRIFVSSRYLEKKFAGSGKRVTLLRNAFDMALLPPVQERSGASHIGFIGCMGGWFDWSALREVAVSVRPAPVTLIGPQVSRAPARLPDNIAIHPPCSQQDGVRWMRQFSVGLIPFTVDALTAGVDPIKYYQYRGAGLPVLSTGFGEMAERRDKDGTFLFGGGRSLQDAVTRALNYRAVKDEIETFRVENTWTARFGSAGIWKETPL